MTPRASDRTNLDEFGGEDAGYGLRPVADLPEEQYPVSPRRSYWAYFGLGLLVGAGVGAVAALLLAPRTGRESRRLLRETTAALAERTSDAVSAAAIPERLGTISEAVAAAGIPERLGALAERTSDAVAASGLPDRLGALAERTGEAVGAARLPERLGSLNLPERLPVADLREAAGARIAEVRSRPFWRRFRAA
jgi:gas vesicle protein